MRQLSSRLLTTALAKAVLVALPALGHAQAMDTVKAAAAKVLPAATQVVQQKVGGSSGGAAPSGTTGQVVNAVKQVAASPQQPQQGNGTVTQKAVGVAKQLVSRRKSQPAQPTQPAASSPPPPPPPSPVQQYTPPPPAPSGARPSWAPPP